MSLEADDLDYVERAPKDATHYGGQETSLYYKIGSHGMVFMWIGDKWIRSAIDDSTMRGFKDVKF